MRKYNCANCSNHGLKISKRNHKICKFKDCECGQCEVTKNLQKVLRLSIAMRRSKVSPQGRVKRKVSKYADKTQVCNEFLRVINDPLSHYANVVQQMYLNMKNDILQVFYKIIQSCNGDTVMASEQAKNWIRSGIKFINQDFF